MEKFIQNILQAEKIIKTADHMAYVTYPLIKDKRLLLKIIRETKNAVAMCINSILQYEYLYKRIQLYPNPKSNLETFMSKSAKRYNIDNHELKKILDLFEIAERHKQSSMEFIKNGKIIILSENLNHIEVGIEKTKEFLTLSKDILKKTKDNLLRKV